MILTGTITKTLPDGREVHCDWMIDTEKAQLIQIGGEGELVAEDIDLIAKILELDYDEEPDK